jgi:hypothetical protein
LGHDPLDAAPDVVYFLGKASPRVRGVLQLVFVSLRPVETEEVENPFQLAG